MSDMVDPPPDWPRPVQCATFQQSFFNEENTPIAPVRMMLPQKMYGTTIISAACMKS